MCVCVPSTFYERPGVVTSSSSSNNTRTYTCMSQRKLPHHKRWVTASFDALSQKRNPKEQNRQKESFFNLFFLLSMDQQLQKNTLFFCVTKTHHHHHHHFLLLLLLYQHALSSLLVLGKRSSFLSDPHYSITSHTKRRVLCARVLGTQTEFRFSILETH